MIWLSVIALIFWAIDLPQLAFLSLLGMLVAPTVYSFRYIDHIGRYPHDHLTCPWCEQDISITAPWVCGHCKTPNQGNFHNEQRRTFCETCVHCKFAPYALSCPRCSKPIIFKEHEYKQCPEELAWISGFPPKPIERQDTIDERRRRLKL